MKGVGGIMLTASVLICIVKTTTNLEKNQHLSRPTDYTATQRSSEEKFEFSTKQSVRKGDRSIFGITRFRKQKQWYVNEDGDRFTKPKTSLPVIPNKFKNQLVTTIISVENNFKQPNSLNLFETATKQPNFKQFHQQNVGFQSSGQILNSEVSDISTPVNSDLSNVKDSKNIKLLSSNKLQLIKNMLITKDIQKPSFEGGNNVNIVDSKSTSQNIPTILKLSNLLLKQRNENEPTTEMNLENLQSRKVLPITHNFEQPDDSTKLSYRDVLLYGRNHKHSNTNSKPHFQNMNQHWPPFLDWPSYYPSSQELDYSDYAQLEHENSDSSEFENSKEIIWNEIVTKTESSSATNKWGGQEISKCPDENELTQSDLSEFDISCNDLDTTETISTISKSTEENNNDSEFEQSLPSEFDSNEIICNDIVVTEISSTITPPLPTEYNLGGPGKIRHLKYCKDRMVFENFYCMVIRLNECTTKAKALEVVEYCNSIGEHKTTIYHFTTTPWLPDATTTEISTTDDDVESTRTTTEEIGVSSTTSIPIETTSEKTDTTTYDLSMHRGCRRRETVGEQTIEWKPSSYDKKLYVASRHCLSDGNLYRTKICENNDFLDKSKCTKVQNFTNLCPKGFKNYGYYCYTILDATTYEKSVCPYYYTHLMDQSFQSSDFLWYPAERSGYGGEFIYRGFNENYGLIVRDVIEESDNPDADCLIYNDRVLKAVPCNGTYKRACFYVDLFRDKRNFCQMGRPYEKCIPSSFNTNDLSCMCGVLVDQTCSAPSKLQPEHYMFGMVMDGCKIPAKVVDSTLQWLTMEMVEPTYWSQTIPKSYKDTDDIILDAVGWHFTDVKPKCKICVFDYSTDYKLPELILNFKNNFLELTVEQVINVVTTTGSKSKFYAFCFTDGLKNAAYERVFAATGSSKFELTHSGRYDCEVFGYKNFERISKSGLYIAHNIFVVDVEIQLINDVNPRYFDEVHDRYFRGIELNMRQSYSNFEEIKIMKVLSVDRHTRVAKYVLHITTTLNKEKYMDEYKKIQNVINTMKLSHVKTISELFNSDYCMYTTDGDLSWNQTVANAQAKANEVCLDETGWALSRNCIPSYLYGTRWEMIQPCLIQATHSEVSPELHDLLISNGTSEEIAENLTNLIDKSGNKFEPIDVYFVSKILQKHLIDAPLPKLMQIVSQTMDIQRKTLMASQGDLNATDHILNTLDDAFLKSKRDLNDTVVETSNLAAFIFDAKTTNWTGFGLKRNYSGYEVIKIGRGMTIEALTNIPRLELATYIPDDLLAKISKMDDSKVVINFLLLDSLFNHDADLKVIAKNFGILLPVEAKLLNYSIPLIYKPQFSAETVFCGYWNYGAKQRGAWKREAHAVSVNSFNLCEINHVTHFGLLVMDNLDGIIGNPFPLETITTIESILSLFGIAGIFLTGLLFKNWRCNSGNKILMNYAVVSLLQISVLHLAGYPSVLHSAKWVCVVIGVVLHFTVLSQFCWMLVIAYLQYMRYVKVLHGPQRLVFAKSFITGYVLPAVPILILLVSSWESYVAKGAGLCYPSGVGLIASVLVPIGMVLVVNLFIFGRIVAEMFCSRTNKCVDDGIFILRFRLVVLLFFMLGITWFFGLAAEIFQNSFLLYLFTITAPIQGFVIFIFFIVLNENARKMYVYTWKKYVR